MNTIKITIDGQDYTKKVVFPLKWADLLDERLDEARITLKNVLLQTPFRPLSEVVITLINSPECKVIGYKQNSGNLAQKYDSTTHRLTQTMIKRYIVANDTVNEYPVGTKLHTHELYIIEETKLLEGFIGDSLSFTNPLGSNYLSENS